MIDYIARLDALADPKLACFQRKLTPGLTNNKGVRVPAMRSLAKEILKQDDWRSFLDVDSDLCDVIMLQGFVVTYAKISLEERLRFVDVLVPKMDNWMECDIFATKWKYGPDDMATLWDALMGYAASGTEFGMRFAAIMLMSNFNDDAHIDELLVILGGMKHDGYYLKMGVAWALSFCFIKYPEKTLAFLGPGCPLDDWTLNTTIKKIGESYRVSDEMKTAAKSLRR